MAEEIIFLEPGEAQAQKIAKAMSSPTAGDLLRNLSEAPKSTTALAEELHIPLTTAKYHLGNLLDAGIIEVVDTRWSAKGREIKLYSMKNQVLIVAPRRQSAIGMVKKYAATLGVFIAGTAIISLYLPILQTNKVSGDMMAFTAAPPETMQIPDAIPMATRAAGGAGTPLPPMVHEFVTAFFLGGCLVLAALIMYEALIWFRDERR
ncbi:helix-turn-helix transcriptional regulator [Methanocalculus taiwanensis]|uniref:Helix-turn-helix transcriptional regulator n=1 Tax=Methanocalculus taiwanensis TaxID=106207 RepID=A0ABD4TGT8_9EURY|nr:helix-turn-helix domain-containing protein [Methanocalculus taiwanensis]MCQ1537716.1 helix-turn-helix transcriptional regulator [Methanocalculus taiwanensis]